MHGSREPERVRALLELLLEHVIEAAPRVVAEVREDTASELGFLLRGRQLGFFARDREQHAQSLFTYLKLGGLVRRKVEQGVQHLEPQARRNSD